MMVQEVTEDEKFDPTATYIYRDENGNVVEVSGLDAMQVFYGGRKI